MTLVPTPAIHGMRERIAAPSNMAKNGSRSLQRNLTISARSLGAGRALRPCSSRRRAASADVRPSLRDTAATLTSVLRRVAHSVTSKASKRSSIPGREVPGGASRAKSAGLGASACPAVDVAALRSAPWRARRALPETSSRPGRIIRRVGGLWGRGGAGGRSGHMRHAAIRPRNPHNAAANRSDLALLAATAALLRAERGRSARLPAA